MITEINKNGVVTCKAYGFPPGKYLIAEFTADDLLDERRILATFCQAHKVAGNLFLRLDNQIARAIDDKFDKDGKEIKA